MKFEIEKLTHSAENKPVISHDFALEVLEGLSRKPKWLPSKYFYDKKGSELFAKITDSADYYPTACEFEVLESRKRDIANLLGGKAFNLIELGAGDGRKTFVLLNHFLKDNLDFKYYPIDISRDAIVTLLETMEKKVGGSSNLEAKGLEAEYVSGLNWISEHDKRTNLILFLGSSIGNFNTAGAQRFLRHLWYSLNPGDYVLIGYDLKKDLDILYRAYNDSGGITAEFNLNLLDRINEELGADFDRSTFMHQGLYNVQSGAMESFLISTKRQIVNIKELGKAFRFKSWEGIHVEYSYKYTLEDIERLALETGFKIVDNFFDSKRYFVDSIWQVKK